MRIVFVGILLMLASFGLFEWEQLSGAPDAQARTVAVNVFAVISTLYLFSCRSLERSFFKVGPLSNKWILMGACLMVLLQLAFTYVPFMNTLFHTTPIGNESWLRIVAVALVAGLVIAVEKWLWARRGASRMKRATTPLPSHGQSYVSAAHSSRSGNAKELQSFDLLPRRKQR
jgi:magnesium-transporting ATPase (P-type)